MLPADLQIEHVHRVAGLQWNIIGTSGRGESRTEIADLIAHTVEGWDAQETSDRIELQVGRDLQYIRINGTVVGGLVGLIIHLIAQVLG